MGYKDRAKSRAKVLAQGDNFKLKEGENFVRILPTPESAEGAEDDVFYEILMHNDVGQEKRFLRCGKDAHDPTQGECYICDVVVPRLITNGNQETAKKLKPRWSGVVQALALGDDNKPSGPHFWMVGGKLGKNLLLLLGQSNRDYASATKGYWIYVNRTGSGLQTEYSAPIPDPDPTELSGKWATLALKPFEQLTELPVYSEQVCKDAWLGAQGAAAERPQSPSSRRAGVMDEDEAPAPRSARRTVVADDDDPPSTKKAAPVVTKKPAAKSVPVEELEDEGAGDVEGPTREEILASPPLKVRDAITGDRRYKVEVSDGKFVAMTADGFESKGLAEGAVPTNPGKFWLKEHPEYEPEVEEPEELAEDEPEENPAPARAGRKPAATPAVEPEDDDPPVSRSTKAGKGSTKQASLPLDDDDPPVKTSTKAGAAKPKAAAVIDDDEDPFGED